MFRARSHPQFLTALLLIPILAGAVYWSAHRPLREEAVGMQVIDPADSLSQSAGLELRFEQLVVPENKVGVADTRTILRVDPPLPGEFIWLSQRSGAFFPSQKPQPGRTYVFLLARGLTDADGRPLDARLRHVWTAPDFALLEMTPGFTGTNEIDPQPTLHLVFNQPLDESGLEKWFNFRDASGRDVPARVQPAVDNADGPAPSASLFVFPARPLPAGDGWSLLVEPGLRSADGKARLQARETKALGYVEPFRLESATAHNTIGHGKRITLTFNKPLDPTLTLEEAAQFLSVQPAPTNLALRLWTYQASFEGAFQLDRDYEVIARHGLRSRQIFSLETNTTRRVRFEPVPPRLYFPELDTVQWNGGRAVYPLLAVNTPTTRVRVKQLDRHTLVHALRGFRHYRKDWGGTDAWTEPFREIPFDLVPGITIFETNYDSSAPPGQARQLELPWSDLAAGARSGAFFLQAESRRPAKDRLERYGTESIVQLSDLGAVWKLSPSGRLIYVFSLSTGEPIPQATVYLATEENEILHSAETDSNGLALFQSAPADQRGDWLLIEHGSDLLAQRMDDPEHRLSLYNFAIDTSSSWDSAGNRMLFLFSDRGVYRPGETLHLKGIVRDLAADTLAFPTNRTARLRCFDPRNAVFLSTNVSLSASGSFSQSLRLPDTHRGSCRAEFTVGHESTTCYFMIHDFKADAFQLSFDAQPAFAPNDAIEVTARGRYYFGKPLAHAAATWSIAINNAPFHPHGLDGFAFFDERDWRLRPAALSVGPMQGKAQLSPEGVLVLKPEIPIDAEQPRPREFSLLLEVTDLNQQTLSRRLDFTRHSSDFYLGLRASEDVVPATTNLQLELAAVKADGAFVDHSVPAQLTVQRVHWETVRVQTAGGAISYEDRHELIPVSKRTIHVEPPVPADSAFPLAAPAFSKVPVPLPEAGEYLVTVRSQDATGHPVQTETTVYASGPHSLAWDYRNNAEIKLVPDRASYKPGDQAILLVKTPISGKALVTVERGGVRRSFVTSLEGNAPAITVPIVEGDFPDVFVSVLLLRGGLHSSHQTKTPEYRLGYCQLQVDDSATRLGVNLEVSRREFEPGQTVEVTAHVCDADGRPVAGSEVTLFAVDEGVLSLTDYVVPEPGAFFHRPRPLDVTSGLSLPALFPEEEERHSFGNKGYLVGGGGLAGQNVRRRFLPCPLWEGCLQTDTKGLVRATFSAPDSLTRYRVVAVAQHGARQFGAGESDFHVSKPLSIEPATPAFARRGDHLLARAVILNQTAQAGEVDVTLQLDPKTARGALDTPDPAHLRKRVSLKANGAATVEFPVALIETGLSRWTWSASFAGATTNHYRDAVESPLQIAEPLPLLREIVNLKCAAPQTNLLARLDPRLLEGSGRLTLTIANSPLAWSGEAVQQLLHYPYGCVEQTSSSLIPWLVLRDLQLLDLNRSPEDVQSAVEHGINRLLSMQTASGGLAYWPGSSDPIYWGSAYGGLALSLARQQGWTVPEENLNRLLAYLRNGLQNTAGQNASDRCLALFALATADHAEASYAEGLFQVRATLSQEDRALLALAILRGGGAQDMARTLLNEPVQSTQTNRPWAVYDCDARRRAIHVMAASSLTPPDPAADSLCRELLDKQTDGHWWTTQGNAWSLLALATWNRQINSQLEPSTGAVTWGDTNVNFSLAGSPDAARFDFSLRKNNSSLPLRLSNPNGRALYAQLRLEARPATLTQRPLDHGCQIRRTYSVVNDDGSLVPAGDVPLNVGDRVLVTLDVHLAKDTAYLAVDDPLPSVLEPVNPDFRTRETLGANRLARWSSDYREVRADRMLFFDNDAAAGDYSLQYLARVRAAGRAFAPPAKVEAMYHPENYGLSASATLVSAPLGATGAR